MTLVLTTIDRGEGSRIIEPRQMIVRSAAEWHSLWAAHAGPGGTAPAVDFATSSVAAAFGGEKPTPGFQVEIVPVDRTGAPPGLVVIERAPARETLVAQVIVTPFHIVTFPRDAGDVRFVREPEAALNEAAAASPLTQPSTTGLAPTVAAGISYLAGPFSGMVILAAEQKNPFVKFHAWQAIVGVGGLGALAVLLLILAFAGLLVSPVLFTLLSRGAALAMAACIVAAVACLFLAFSGRAWKLPLAGEYAERLARPKTKD